MQHARRRTFQAGSADETICVRLPLRDCAIAGLNQLRRGSSVGPAPVREDNN